MEIRLLKYSEGCPPGFATLRDRYEKKTFFENLKNANSTSILKTEIQLNRVNYFCGGILFLEGLSYYYP